MAERTRTPPRGNCPAGSPVESCRVALERAHSGFRAAALGLLLSATTAAQEPADANEPELPDAAEAQEAASPVIEPDAQSQTDDYESSEQISEDLSVSFPVDI